MFVIYGNDGKRYRWDETRFHVKDDWRVERDIGFDDLPPDVRTVAENMGCRREADGQGGDDDED